MSLQTGTQLAKTSGVIIDPRKLIIVAFRINGQRLSQPESVLHPEDIREMSNIGMIVDSDESLMSLNGLIRLQEVIDFDFELVGLRVEDEKGHKLGRVGSYAVDPDSFTVQQIYTKQPLLKSISSMGLTIHRSQIVSIDNEHMVVKDTAVKDASPITETARTFINPFRPAPSQQPDSASLPD